MLVGFEHVLRSSISYIVPHFVHPRALVVSYQISAYWPLSQRTFSADLFCQEKCSSLVVCMGDIAVVQRNCLHQTVGQYQHVKMRG